MKKIAIALLVLVGCQQQAAREPAAAAPETEEQKTSYALGYKLGQNLHGLELDPSEVEAVKEGLGDAAAGREARLDVAQYEAGVQQLAQKRAARVAEERRAGEARFLEQAAAEPGAQRFDSGLVMVHQTEGAGATPGPGDRVSVHYEGTFPDGKVFDGSRQQGEPATFPVSGIIPCWTEALQKMKVGGRARVVCPPALAYGDRGAPPRIPPGATLVFEIELLGIAE